MEAVKQKHPSLSELSSVKNLKQQRNRYASAISSTSKSFTPAACKLLLRWRWRCCQSAYFATESRNEAHSRSGNKHHNESGSRDFGCSSRGSHSHGDCLCPTPSAGPPCSCSELYRYNLYYLSWRIYCWSFPSKCQCFSLLQNFRDTPTAVKDEQPSGTPGIEE